jgi:ACR3 family arsenite transporter
MIVGVLIGYYVPGVQPAFATVEFSSVSVPIAIGLLVMMYPVLCKLQYEQLPMIFSQREIWIQIALSLALNWIVGPILMTGLAWATLFDLEGYRTGVIMVGMARCIAMVLIWNQIALGDADYCAILMVVNSVLQIALYSPLCVLFINIVPTWFGGHVDAEIALEMWPVVESVLIYLGIPLAAGFLTRVILVRLVSKQWYENRFLPRIGPLALIGLLYTIVVMVSTSYDCHSDIILPFSFFVLTSLCLKFANQGHHIVTNIGSVFRVMVPMVCYFILMFFGTLVICRLMGFPYAQAVTQSFTAGSNNFELAIAVAVGVYGIDSDQALAATIGPLIEVPGNTSLQRRTNVYTKSSSNDSLFFIIL